jgi:amidase
VTATSDTELAFAGPGALAARVRAREISARELVELYLRRIEQLDGRLNAFRVTLADEALAAAERLDSDEGARSGALAGVPVAVKDDMALAGQVTTFGSGSPASPAAQDAEVVRRLRAAGAIPIGVTNVPELMIWPWTATDANGITRNPWDLRHTPGGSSGGSAAAVASGMVAAATASDGAGSIRIPAACCGLVGMKPSRGRVSSLPNAEGWLGLSTYGALARTVADSALMLDAIHGLAPGDLEPAAPAPSGSFAQAAARGSAGAGRPLRIAVSRKVPPGLIAGLSADQRQAWDRTARLLGELGHRVEERHPDYGLASVELVQTYFRGIYEDFCRLSDPSLTESSTRQMAAAGRWLVPPRRRDALRARRRRTSERILSLWQDFDVLLTPGLSRTALPAEGGYGRPAPIAFNLAARFTPWTALFNLTGQPAVTVPAGVSPDGLPLSVQLVGRPGAVETLFELAAQLEAAEPWAARRPPTV